MKTLDVDLFALSQDYNVLNKIEKYSWPDPNSGCTLWSGSSPSGRARLMINNKLVSVNRILAARNHGQNLTSNQVVCHKCDTPICVNPQHLFVGSQLDNILDCLAKNRFNRASISKLTEESVKQIRAARALGARRIDVARQYCVKPQTITLVVKRKTWSHVL